MIGVKQFPAWFIGESGSQGGGTTPDLPVTPPATSGSFQKVTSVDEILAGGQFVIGVYVDGKYHFMGDTVANSKITEVTGITVTDDKISGTDLPVWTIAAMDLDTISLYSSKYLYNPSKGNLGMQASEYGWDLSENGQTDTFILKSSGYTSRWLAYSGTASAFKAYAESNIGAAGYTFYLVFFKAV